MSYNKENINQQNSAIITMDDLERIKDTCALMNHDEAWKQQKAGGRKALYEKSKQRVQHWPNTIEALRAKREHDRIKKLEDEEIERRKIGKFPNLMF